MAGAIDVLLVIALSLITAVLAIRFAMGPRSAQRYSAIPPPDAPALLFRDGILQHGSGDLLARLVLTPGWSTLSDAREQLAEQFPALPETLAQTAQGAASVSAPEGGPGARLDLRWRDTLCWVTLVEDMALRDPAVPDRAQAPDHLSLHASTAPAPAWQLGHNGQVVWHNDRYGDLLRRQGHPPDKPLFDPATATADGRVALHPPDRDTPDWYQLHQVRQGALTSCHALPCTDLVTAEVAQRNFVQTLAKIFAHLSIGLAIFDRDGRLALFNPALLDLTGLPAQMLSCRPTALSFFDALRENRHMPEPKNYANWRQDIADVITTAAQGTYKEVWSLEDGRTYSVIGRPHPDGATAFMIEDISAEVTLTRNFRCELELSQAVLDTFDCAVIVFSSAGIVTFTNAAYRALWHHDPDAAFVDVSLQDCIDIWSAQSGPGTHWPQVEAHVMDYQNRMTLQVPVEAPGGAQYLLEIRSLSPDANMIRFTQRQDHGPPADRPEILAGQSV